MPRGDWTASELATILYYASRGFTPEAIRYFLYKKTGRPHTIIPQLIDRMKDFRRDGGSNGKPQIYDSRTEMWHLDGVDNKIRELWSAAEGGIAHITNFRPEDERQLLMVGLRSCLLLCIDTVAGRVWRACFNAPATQRQSSQSWLGCSP